MIPEISEVTMFPEAVSQASSCDWFIFPYECAEGMAYSREIFGSIQPGSTVSVMIGPEGGFEPSEVSEAKRSGARIATAPAGPRNDGLRGAGGRMWDCEPAAVLR